MNALDFLSVKDFLKNIDQEAVFTRYFGIPKVHLNRKYVNPMRLLENKKVDASPSCTFWLYDNILLFKDWAYDISYNCIDVVRIFENITSPEARRLLIEKFQSVNNTISVTSNQTVSDVNSIEFIQDFNDEYKYFRKYKISKATMCGIYQTIPVLAVSVNKVIYTKPKNSPMYITFIDNNNVQLYKPLDVRESKFRTFCRRDSFFGANSIEPGRVLFITSSNKDAACIYESGFPAIALLSETYGLDQQVANYLISVCTKVIVLYDNDAAGRNFSRRLCNLFPSFYRAEWPNVPYKDIAEYRRYKTKSSIKFLRKLVVKALKNDVS